MKITIEAVPHDEQRYPTVGDWQTEYERTAVPWSVRLGAIRVRVSAMSDPRYEFLVGIHEAIEAMLCVYRGVRAEDVDTFDIAFENARKAGDESEPGDDLHAPYYREHQFATGIERLLAAELGVDWEAYNREIASL